MKDASIAPGAELISLAEKLHIEGEEKDEVKITLQFLFRRRTDLETFQRQKTGRGAAGETALALEPGSRCQRAGV